MLEVKDNKSAWSKPQMGRDSWGNYSDEKEMSVNRKNSEIMDLKENHTQRKKLRCIRSNDQEPIEEHRWKNSETSDDKRASCVIISLNWTNVKKEKL